MSLALAVTLVSFESNAGADPPVLDLVAEGISRYGRADFEGSLAVLERARRVAREPGLQARICLYVGANLVELGKTDEAKKVIDQAVRMQPKLSLPGELKESVRVLVRQEQSRRAKEDESWRDDDLFPSPKRPRRTEVAAPVPAPSRERTRATETSTPRDLDRQDASRMNNKQLWGWITAGGAVIAGSLGLGLWLASDADHANWERELEGQADTGRLVELERSIRSKEIGAWAMFGVAGALALTSTVLFLKSRPTSRARRDLDVALSPSGLLVTKRF
jgi:hypothetical protein